MGVPADRLTNPQRRLRESLIQNVSARGASDVPPGPCRAGVAPSLARRVQVVRIGRCAPTHLRKESESEASLTPTITEALRPPYESSSPIAGYRVL